jgi:hypothetical protein
MRMANKTKKKIEKKNNGETQTKGEEEKRTRRKH